MAFESETRLLVAFRIVCVLYHTEVGEEFQLVFIKIRLRLPDLWGEQGVKCP